MRDKNGMTQQQREAACSELRRLRQLRVGYRNMIPALVEAGQEQAAVTNGLLALTAGWRAESYLKAVRMMRGEE